MGSGAHSWLAGWLAGLGQAAQLQSALLIESLCASARGRSLQKEGPGHGFEEALTTKTAQNGAWGSRELPILTHKESLEVHVAWMWLGLGRPVRQAQVT